MNSLDTKIERLSKLAQSIIDKLRACDPSNHAFEQLGILNGDEIINHYMEHGEPGLALEHLLYVIYESRIDFAVKELGELHSLARELKIEHSYGDKNA